MVLGSIAKGVNNNTITVATKKCTKALGNPRKKIQAAKLQPTAPAK
jgi:hypothetical protein